jgi:DNA-binding SARP family transcriptional activator
MALGFLILGPFEVHLDGEALALGGRQQRALLAALTLRANELVSSERLIDELWPEDPPDTADHLVHVYVSRLRKALGDEGRSILVTRPPGYQLLLKPGQVDLDRFETLVAAARLATGEGRITDASAHLREALALWRGPALADLANESFARADAERLNEFRISATEDLMGSELAEGRRDVVPELKSLVAQQPLRERLCGYLMVALYREGRQAESLNAYERTRAVLADELGIDPSHGLQELHRRVLTQDATLILNPQLLERRTVDQPGESAPDRGRSGSGTRRRRVVTGLAASLALLASIVLIASSLLPGDGEPSRGMRASVAQVGTEQDTTVGQLYLGGSPSTLAIDASTLWVADDAARTVTQIDISTRSTETIGAIGFPFALVAGSGRAWVLDPFGGTVVMIDGQGSPRTIKRSQSPLDAVFAFGSLWVLEGIDEAVLRLDPEDGRLQARIPLHPGAGPIKIAASPSAIWVLNTLHPSLSRIDGSGVLAPNDIPLFCGSPSQVCRPTELQAGPDSLWVSMSEVGVVEQFDVDGTPRRTLDGLNDPTDLAPVADGVWIMVKGGLIRISGDGRIVERWHASEPVMGLAVEGARPWVSLGP